MKIIAQSSVPSRMSYHHLGYTAATSNASSALLKPGALVIIIGFLLLLRRIRGSQPMSFTLRRSGKLFWAAMAIVGIGVLIIVAGYTPGGRPLHPEAMTYSRAVHIATEMKERGLKGEAIPEDLPSLREAWQLGAVRDAWDREMTIRKEIQNDRMLYLVVSAGADGRFDTDDDIVCPDESDREYFFLPPKKR